MKDHMPGPAVTHTAVMALRSRERVERLLVL